MSRSVVLQLSTQPWLSEWSDHNTPEFQPIELQKAMLYPSCRQSCSGAQCQDVLLRAIAQGAYSRPRQLEPCLLPLSFCLSLQGPGPQVAKLRLRGNLIPLEAESGLCEKWSCVIAPYSIEPKTSLQTPILRAGFFVAHFCSPVPSVSSTAANRSVNRNYHGS